ncbi:DUF1906 domain-containing protein [Corynebacterium minutissimum]|uniref:DUF1906 domain-containing protein n=1 Tax=Corynebacterium minutissimum TaxID=38301 RepID=UPI00215D937D|nr:DUF1906 domain-containing protein [Corynebacterium minutissimum]
MEYFRAAVDVLGRSRVGIYGHSRVIAWAAEDGVVADLGGGKVLGWQTPAWSQGARAPEAVLYQGVANTPGPDGVKIDINDVLHDYWARPRLPPPGAGSRFRGRWSASTRKCG